MKIDEAKLDRAANRLVRDMFGERFSTWAGPQAHLREWLRDIIESVQDESPAEEPIDLGLPWFPSGISPILICDKMGRPILGKIDALTDAEWRAYKGFIIRACNGYEKAVAGIWKLRHRAITKPDYGLHGVAKAILEDLGELNE